MTKRRRRKLGGLELEVDLIHDPFELLLRSRLGFDDFKK